MPRDAALDAGDVAAYRGATERHLSPSLAETPLYWRNVRKRARRGMGNRWRQGGHPPLNWARSGSHKGRVQSPTRLHRPRAQHFASRSQRDRSKSASTYARDRVPCPSGHQRCHLQGSEPHGQRNRASARSRLCPATICLSSSAPSALPRSRGSTRGQETEAAKLDSPPQARDKTIFSVQRKE
jgi:hypothetical protein